MTRARPPGVWGGRLSDHTANIGAVVSSTLPYLTQTALLETRSLWWRLRRQGVPLPAQPGVILIAGGSSS